MNLNHFYKGQAWIFWIMNSETPFSALQIAHGVAYTTTDSYIV